MMYHDCGSIQHCKVPSRQVTNVQYGDEVQRLEGTSLGAHHVAPRHATCVPSITFDELYIIDFTGVCSGLMPLSIEMSHGSNMKQHT